MARGNTHTFTLSEEGFLKSLEKLESPSGMVCEKIIKDKAPGKLDVVFGMFPPGGVSRMKTAVEFAFEERKGVPITLNMVVRLVASVDDDQICLVGQLTQRTWTGLIEGLTYFSMPTKDKLLVGARFSPQVRTGRMWLSWELREIARQHIDLMYEKSRVASP